MQDKAQVLLEVIPGSMSGFASIAGGMGQAIQVFSYGFGKIGENLSLVDSILASTGLLVLTLGVHAAQASGEFDRSMKIVQAVSQQTDGEIARMSTTALDMSKNYRIAVGDMTDGMATLGRAGLTSVNSQIQTMETSIRLAKIEGQDLNSVIEQLISTTSLLGGDVDAVEFGAQSEKVGNLMLGTSLSAPLEISDVVQTLKYAGGTASVAGINLSNEDMLKDLMGTISAFSLKGVKGDMAGTALRAFFTKPASQDKSVTDAFDRIGLNPGNLWQAGENEMKPVSEQLSIIREHMTGLSQMEKVELWGKIVGPKMGQQMMKITPAEISKQTQKIGNTDAGNLAEHTMQNFASDWEKMMKTAEASWIQFGEKIVVFLDPVVKFITMIADLLSNPAVSAVAFVGAFALVGRTVIAGINLVKEFTGEHLKSAKSFLQRESEQERATKKNISAMQQKYNMMRQVRTESNLMTKGYGDFLGQYQVAKGLGRGDEFLASQSGKMVTSQNRNDILEQLAVKSALDAAGYTYKSTEDIQKSIDTYAKEEFSRPVVPTKDSFDRKKIYDDQLKKTDTSNLQYGNEVEKKYDKEVEKKYGKEIDNIIDKRISDIQKQLDNYDKNVAAGKSNRMHSPSQIKAFDILQHTKYAVGDSPVDALNKKLYQGIDVPIDKEKMKQIDSKKWLAIGTEKTGDPRYSKYKDYNFPGGNIENNSSMNSKQAIDNVSGLPINKFLATKVAAEHGLIDNPTLDALKEGMNTGILDSLEQTDLLSNVSGGLLSGGGDILNRIQMEIQGFRSDVGRMLGGKASQDVYSITSKDPNNKQSYVGKAADFQKRNDQRMLDYLRTGEGFNYKDESRKDSLFNTLSGNPEFQKLMNERGSLDLGKYGQVTEDAKRVLPALRKTFGQMWNLNLEGTGLTSAEASILEHNKIDEFKKKGGNAQSLNILPGGDYHPLVKRKQNIEKEMKELERGIGSVDTHFSTESQRQKMDKAPDKRRELLAEREGYSKQLIEKQKQLDQVTKDLKTVGKPASQGDPQRELKNSKMLANEMVQERELAGKDVLKNILSEVSSIRDILSKGKGTVKDSDPNKGAKKDVTGQPLKDVAKQKGMSQEDVIAQSRARRSHYHERGMNYDPRNPNTQIRLDKQKEIAIYKGMAIHEKSLNISEKDLADQKKSRKVTQYLSSIANRVAERNLIESQRAEARNTQDIQKRRVQQDLLSQATDQQIQTVRKQNDVAQRAYTGSSQLQKALVSRDPVAITGQKDVGVAGLGLAKAIKDVGNKVRNAGMSAAAAIKSTPGRARSFAGGVRDSYNQNKTYGSWLTNGGMLGMYLGDYGNKQSESRDILDAWSNNNKMNFTSKNGARNAILNDLVPEDQWDFKKEKPKKSYTGQGGKHTFAGAEINAAKLNTTTGKIGSGLASVMGMFGPLEAGMMGVQMAQQAHAALLEQYNKKLEGLSENLVTKQDKLSKSKEELETSLGNAGLDKDGITKHMDDLSTTIGNVQTPAEMSALREKLSSNELAILDNSAEVGRATEELAKVRITGYAGLQGTATRYGLGVEGGTSLNRGLGGVNEILKANEEGGFFGDLAISAANAGREILGMLGNTYTSADDIANRGSWSLGSLGTIDSQDLNEAGKIGMRLSNMDLKDIIKTDAFTAMSEEARAVFADFRTWLSGNQNALIIADKFYDELVNNLKQADKIRYEEYKTAGIIETPEQEKTNSEAKKNSQPTTLPSTRVGSTVKYEDILAKQIKARDNNILEGSANIDSASSNSKLNAFIKNSREKTNQHTGQSSISNKTLASAKDVIDANKELADVTAEATKKRLKETKSTEKLANGIRSMANKYDLSERDLWAAQGLVYFQQISEQGKSQLEMSKGIIDASMMGNNTAAGILQSGLTQENWEAYQYATLEAMGQNVARIALEYVGTAADKEAKALGYESWTDLANKDPNSILNFGQGDKIKADQAQVADIVNKGTEGFMQSLGMGGTRADYYNTVKGENSDKSESWINLETDRRITEAAGKILGSKIEIQNVTNNAKKEGTSAGSSSGSSDDKSKSSGGIIANLALCNRIKVPRFDVNLFKKAPKISIYNKNMKNDIKIDSNLTPKQLTSIMSKSLLDVANKTSPKIIQTEDDYEFDPVGATGGTNLPTNTETR